jgi:hypothetical protein
MVHWQREYGQSKWHKCLEMLNLMVIRDWLYKNQKFAYGGTPIFCAPVLKGLGLLEYDIKINYRCSFGIVLIWMPS